MCYIGDAIVRSQSESIEATQTWASTKETARGIRVTRSKGSISRGDLAIAKDGDRAKTKWGKYPGFSQGPVLWFYASPSYWMNELSWQGSLGNAMCTSQLHSDSEPKGKSNGWLWDMLSHKVRHIQILRIYLSKNQFEYQQTTSV